MMTMLIAASSEPDRGWGGPIALLVAIVLFGLFIGVQEYVRPEDPSPTEDDESGVTANPEVNSVSDTDDTDDDTPWWGKLVTLPDGRRVRRASPVDETADDDLDLALDGDRPETMEAAAARLVAANERYMDSVRHLIGVHRVSEATAKRAIRAARNNRGATPREGRAVSR